MDKQNFLLSNKLSIFSIKLKIESILLTKFEEKNKVFHFGKKDNKSLSI